MGGMDALWGSSFQSNGRETAPCPDCGSSDIATGLVLSQNVEAGPFGILYRAVGVFRGTERLQADLCRNCGSVTRMFVKNFQRNWIRQ